MEQIRREIGDFFRSDSEIINRYDLSTLEPEEKIDILKWSLKNSRSQIPISIIKGMDYIELWQAFIFFIKDPSNHNKALKIFLEMKDRDMDIYEWLLVEEKIILSIKNLTNIQKVAEIEELKQRLVDFLIYGSQRGVLDQSSERSITNFLDNE